MRDFVSLESAMQRAVLLSSGVCLVLLALTIASMAFAFTAVSGAHEAAQHMPVLVVPGAVGGIYSPGITEENLRATARYLANLATNFGSASSFQQRFDELETFASPAYLPQLQRARAGLQHEVETQNQSRSFFAAPATETLRQAEAGHFEYSTEGERVVYASGLPMDTRHSLLRLRLQWGVPSAHNRAGIALEGFSVTDLPAQPTSARRAR